MEKKSRKIKIWGKIKLYETSVVGIPAYPDAHMSADEFSLIKALSESSDELNLEKTNMPEEKENPADESQETQEPESPEEEPSKEDPKPEEPEKVAKPITLKDVSEVVNKAMEKALKSSETERGLVMTEESVKEKLSKKSIGELAMMQGLFIPK